MTQGRPSRSLIGSYYGLVFFVSVIWFESKAELLGDIDGILIPYVSVVLLSGALASYFSELYQRDAKSWIYWFGIAAAPIAISVSASVLAAVIYLVAGALQFGAEPLDGGAVEHFFAVFYLAAVFILTAFPALSMGLLLVTGILVYKPWAKHVESAP